MNAIEHRNEYHLFFSFSSFLSVCVFFFLNKSHAKYKISFTYIPFEYPHFSSSLENTRFSFHQFPWKQRKQRKKKRNHCCSIPFIFRVLCVVMLRIWILWRFFFLLPNLSYLNLYMLIYMNN